MRFLPIAQHDRTDKGSCPKPEKLPAPPRENRQPEQNQHRHDRGKLNRPQQDATFNGPVCLQLADHPEQEKQVHEKQNPGRLRIGHPTLSQNYQSNKDHRERRGIKRQHGKNPNILLAPTDEFVCKEIREKECNDRDNHHRTKNIQHLPLPALGRWERDTGSPQNDSGKLNANYVGNPIPDFIHREKQHPHQGNKLKYQQETKGLGIIGLRHVSFRER